MGTQELEIKYNQHKKPNQERHVLHPFRFYCDLCKTELLCKHCKDYNHDYCKACLNMLDIMFGMGNRKTFKEKFQYEQTHDKMFYPLTNFGFPEKLL